MSKFAIVGCEASGKTVFMSALTDLFRASLVPENAAANRFARFAARQLRSLRQWPPATNPGKTVEMAFSLRDQGQSLAEFRMLEFGGETFRAAFREDAATPSHQQGVKELLRFLDDASFVLVLVSLKELFRDPGDTPLDEYERDTESIWVTRGLIEFIRNNVPDASIVIGLSQADRFRDRLTAEGGPEAVFADHWPSIRALTEGLPVLPVASVSATDNEGRPVEKFTTDGILPVLREFAKQQYGTSQQILKDLEGFRALLNRPLPPSPNLAAMNEAAKNIKTATERLNDLKRYCALSQEKHAKEIAVLDDTLTRARETLKNARTTLPHPPPPKRRRTRQSGSPMKTVLLLLLLLLAAVLLLINERMPLGSLAKSLVSYISINAASPSTSEVDSIPIITNISSTVTKSTAAANNSPANAQPTTSASTTSVSPKVATFKPDPAFRIWHDHRGKPIEAQWLDTAEDGKSITLKTRSGRILKAVIHKFSDADQEFIRKTISPATPATVPRN